VTIAAFSGTRKGMTLYQRQKFPVLLAHYGVHELHHGDCIGADAQAHKLARQHNPRIWIVVHPPQNPKNRAYCKGDATNPERPYLVRNQLLIDASQMLIATPKSRSEDRRSGTWHAIRYARTQHVRPIVIVWPDGSITREY
jgi:hypothetical protein